MGSNTPLFKDTPPRVAYRTCWKGAGRMTSGAGAALSRMLMNSPGPARRKLTTMLTVWLQLFPIFGLLCLGTPCNPCPPPLCVGLTCLHRISRISGFSHRGNFAATADLQKPQRAVLQGFPPFRHCELAGRRCDEDELFLSQQSTRTLAISLVWDLPGLLRYLPGVTVLHVRGGTHHWEP